WKQMLRGSTLLGFGACALEESRRFVNQVRTCGLRETRTYTPPWNGPSRDHHPEHSRVIPPPHLVHPHRLLEPLRHELPAVGEEERDPAALASHRRDNPLSAWRACWISPRASSPAAWDPNAAPASHDETTAATPTAPR